jgi:hypothetical protein
LSNTEEYKRKETKLKIVSRKICDDTVEEEKGSAQKFSS